MTDQFNPYASPAHLDEAPDAALDALNRAQRKRLEIGEVMVAWEKRRLWYNAILAVATLLGLALHMAYYPDLILEEILILSMMIVPANMCFCAGPFVEGYWTWFFGPVRYLRGILFWGGTLASSLVALAVTL